MIIKKLGYPIPETIKSQVIEAIKNPDCNVPALAKLYKISTTTIYGWRKEYAISLIGQQARSDNNFVELALEPAKSSTINLQKVNLVFDQFSLTVEGQFAFSRLISVIKSLEESC